MPTNSDALQVAFWQCDRRIHFYLRQRESAAILACVGATFSFAYLLLPDHPALKLVGLTACTAALLIAAFAQWRLHVLIRRSRVLHRALMALVPAPPARRIDGSHDEYLA